MNTFKKSDTLGKIVVTFPKAVNVFKEHHIDFCCGGDRTIDEASKVENFDLNHVLNQINQDYQAFQSIKTDDIDWFNVPIFDLVNHILNTHHAYLYATLPRLSELTTTILRVHGHNHPELAKVHKLFHLLKMELEGHLIKEETIQYPAIESFLESNDTTDLQTAKNVISELNDEHLAAGDILKELRKVTNNFEVPKDGCNTYQVTYRLLTEMESDIFNHIHLENNILFHRIREMV